MQDDRDLGAPLRAKAVPFGPLCTCDQMDVGLHGATPTRSGAEAPGLHHHRYLCSSLFMLLDVCTMALPSSTRLERVYGCVCRGIDFTRVRRVPRSTSPILIAHVIPRPPQGARNPPRRRWGGGGERCPRNLHVDAELPVPKISLRRSHVCLRALRGTEPFCCVRRKRRTHAV